MKGGRRDGAKYGEMKRGKRFGSGIERGIEKTKQGNKIGDEGE